MPRSSDFPGGISRRTFTRQAGALAALASLAPVSAHAARPGAAPFESPRDAGDDEPEQIALVLYPRMTALDMVAPQYALASLMNVRVHLVAASLAPIETDTGITITPSTTLADCPANLAVLFVPGGLGGTFAAMEDAAFIAFLADRGSRARYVTSVCTGSLLLGAAGLLRGYQATSHWLFRDSLKQFGAVPTDARVVTDRNRMTGGGVTAGMDFGLTLAATMRGRAYAELVQLLAEYSPAPPFRAGTPAEAGPETVGTIRKFYARNIAAGEATIERAARRAPATPGM